MRKLLIAAAVVALFLVALPFATAGASPPSQVVITDETVFVGPLLGAGPFQVSGPGVAIVCDVGAQADLGAKPSGYQSGKGVNLQVFKEFTCTEGPVGSFVMKLQIREDRNGNRFNWTIVSGTGSYERLRGSGKGIGEWVSPNEIHNTYTGGIHID